jgi:hypothetical protein
MKHLFHRLLKLAQVVLLLAVLAIIAGVPPLWAGYTALFVLDFAAIAWVGDESTGGGRRTPIRTPLAVLGLLSAYATPASFGFF